MNILKPQIKYMDRLDNKKIIDIKSSEDLEQYNFENEGCNNIELWDLKIEYGKFNHICMQKGKLEKVTFKDVIFESCDFSNTEFIESTFIRCEFRNCKISGCNLSENRLYNVSFIETNASYINLSIASIENILFQDTNLRNSYFQETKMKNIYFENVDLCRTQFFKTSLKNIDLSSCKIEEIVISIEDIKGAIIDQLQAIDLLYLIGVKVK